MKVDPADVAMEAQRAVVCYSVLPSGRTDEAWIERREVGRRWYDRNSRFRSYPLQPKLVPQAMERHNCDARFTNKFLISSPGHSVVGRTQNVFRI